MHGIVADEHQTSREARSAPKPRPEALRRPHLQDNRKPRGTAEVIHAFDRQTPQRNLGRSPDPSGSVPGARPPSRPVRSAIAFSSSHHTSAARLHRRQAYSDIRGDLLVETAYQHLSSTSRSRCVSVSKFVRISAMARSLSRWILSFVIGSRRRG